MKRIFLLYPLAIVLLFLASCATSKKVESVKVAESVAANVTETTHTAKTTETVVDTTRTAQGKITITEIIFDTTPDVATINTDSLGSPRGQPVNGSMITSQMGNTRRNSTIDLSNIGTINGAVKSIKQTVIESTITEKGESRESNDQKQSNSNASALQKQSTEETKVATTPQISPWRYFWVGAALAAVLVVLLYLKRIPILNWIKTILS